jgi:hypothetical protein
MNALSFDDALKPDAAVRALIIRFGTRATLFAVIRLAWRRSNATPWPVLAEDLPDWIRKDVGLPERPADVRGRFLR